VAKIRSYLGRTRKEGASKAARGVIQGEEDLNRIDNVAASRVLSRARDEAEYQNQYFTQKKDGRRKRGNGN